MTSLDHALRFLDDKLPALEKDLETLVAENSFTDHVEGGNRVGAMLRELFAIPGLTTERIPSPSGKFAEHLAFATAAPGARTLLVGHLDTVFPPGVFEGYRRDGDLRRGPGVLDMKGGLVVVAWTLRALAAEGLLEGLPLSVIVVADEEVGSPEGRPIIEAHAKNATQALVFEAGRARDAIITQRKGTGGLTVTATGKAAHAGNLHHEGVNAIWALARFVDLAQKLTDYGRGRTVNVGKFTGGQGKNTVPDRAEALLDVRFTSKADGEALVRELHEAAAAAAASVPGSSVTVSGGVARAPLERTDASTRLAERYGEGARTEGLGFELAPLLGGGSDANTTSALGIASIDGLGPRGKGFHTVDEQIEVISLLPKAKALLRLLLANR